MEVFIHIKASNAKETSGCLCNNIMYDTLIIMKISFCTTCMGRAHHLKETLPKNISDNLETKGLELEFVVLNYNSQDDLHEWITTDHDMVKYIESGLVKYGRTTDPELFHMSHAKNMAHRMATGDVLCNLDADNFTGKDFAKFLQDNFSEDMDIVINPSTRVTRLCPPDDRGFFGRIAVSKDNFFKLHGYDESFLGWGGEDTDFMQRAKGVGCKHVRIDCLKYLDIIEHSNEDRVVNMVNEDQKQHELGKVEEIKSGNESIYSKLFNKLKVLIHPVQANSDGSFGNGLVHMESGRDLYFGRVSDNSMSPFNVCVWGLPELVRGRLSPRIAHDDKNEYNLS